MPSALALAHAGIELQVKGDLSGASLHYQAALQEDRNCLPALQNLGQMANDRHELEVARVFVTRILTLVPNDGIQWSNLGNILTRAAVYDKALIALTRATQLEPGSPGVWHNFALLHLKMREYSKALECFEKTEKLGKHNLGLQNDKAHVLLYLGHLGDAWPYYEARWSTMKRMSLWNYNVPEWQGEDLKGKRVLVHSEQGFGDSIMWLRFARRLRELGADVVIGVHRVLCPLFESQSYTTLAIEDMTDENTTGFDYQSPMFSTMRWLGINQKSDISTEPYIFVESNGALRKSFRIGICWASGRRGSDTDLRGRYTNLRDWLCLAEMPNVELVSLQPSFDGEEVERIGAEGLIETRSIGLSKDWLDTAEIIADLDLVISVDTAVVHLAGAMGKPVWMLSQFDNCWRWWDIDNGTGLPWYENIRIMRQSKPGDWKSCIDVCKGWLWERNRVRAVAA